MKFANFAAAAAMVVAAVCVSAVAAPQYSIKLLDAAPGQTDVYATGINNSGQIVGYTIDGNGASSASLWDGSSGAHSPLPVLSAANPHSEAYRINNNGQIVGLARNDAGVNQAAYWDSNGVLGLGALNGTGFSFANDINDNGVIVGSSVATNGQHAFSWTQGGGFVDNGSNGPTSNQEFAGWNGVNDSGQTTGTAYRLFSPFKASMGTITSRQPTVISPVGQFSTGMGLAINNAGVMVGYQNGGSGSPHPAIFNGDGTWQDLGTLGLGEGWAEDINDNGLIVGRVMGDDGTGNFVQRAMFYQDGTQYELLQQLIDPSGWTVLFQATGVNDLGQMVGAGIFNGEIRAYVASPIPEPAALSALVLTAGALVARRRNRR